MKRDIFVCHAGEDRQGVVRPLVVALEKRGVSCWLDEAEIMWGDSITEKVNEGLRISRFVIVVLSAAFLAKKWPQRELNAVLNIEAVSGEVKVLPLLVGNKDARADTLKELPLLNDKLYLSWEGDPEPLVDAALVRLSRISQANLDGDKPTDKDRVKDNIRMPKIKKGFSQRDKDLFLKETFATLKNYFRNALSQLEESHPEVETDFIEVHQFKFFCKIYLRGEIKNQGKFWFSGFPVSNAIAYSEGRFNIDRDDSYNELITVDEDGFDLYLRFSMGVIYQQQETTRLSPTGAAEELWKRLSSTLEY